MAEESDLPLLNPVLRLQMEPALESRSGGGKGRDSIVYGRLEDQKKRLSGQAEKLYASRGDYVTFGGKILLIARMFSDSLAPSHTPTDLFAPLHGCRLVAPLHMSYLVEADLDQFDNVVAEIQSPRGYAVQADISRVSHIELFDDEARMRGRSIDDLWESAPESDGGRLFIVWLTPFRDRKAREVLFQRIAELSDDRTLLPVFSRGFLPSPGDDATRETRPAVVPRQSNIARAMRNYRNTGVGYTTVLVPDRGRLAALIASGAASRIDPVRRLMCTSPGEGLEPSLPLQLGNAPIVAVIDGGLHAPSYRPAEVWRARPLVPDHEADRRHGNGVSSLVVHAHAWNNNRNLPALECRIGTVQAVPHENSRYPLDEQELIDHLDATARTHSGGRVWNISANQSDTGPDEDVSFLGHEVRRVVREFDLLPIISIGNVSRHNSGRPSPPADCEAAIVVGGREADNDGNPAQACSVCLSGPGPDGMLKPDVSWFSTLRMIGGQVSTGSSYATPLISSLAAHTFDALRDPTPDLVKALLINATELDEHDRALGWGTPYNGHMPWSCAPGSVTLVWRARLEPGTAYYWNDIPIPPEFVRNGRLFGKARLTAVLNPLVSPFAGANYFSSRLETALQYVDKPGAEWSSLLGSMKESTIRESDAREELKKWYPVRCHSADFTKRGRQFAAASSFRLYARVFTRDLYQFGWQHHSQAGPQEVAFVLTLWSGEERRSIYDSTVQALGTFVESAVLEHEIEQEIEH